MDALYPPTVPGVPADLTTPSRTYRRHTWAAVASLAAFAALYLGMMAWFARTAWRLFSGFGSHTEPMTWLLGIPALFLVAFLVKGLFYVRRGELGTHLRVDAESQPALLAFVHRIADEAGAPRPHAVYLTPDVNASVFYDMSFRNLVWPSKKNLNIGLGLVNVLTLDELKAVLAHEFGHFAQRTMAVGTWVYVARQAIGAVVARRDGFDKFLDGLSRFDLRIAWIGWGMRLLVWSVRVMLDTAFRGVMVLERALSREMEFQADLVSVSLCGSDSLIHALRRLGAADDALSRAMGMATTEGRAGRPVADLYDVQARMLEELRTIWDDPSLGDVPMRPADGAAGHRVFSPAIAEVPRMWATHPPSHEREENAKRRYIPSVLDSRPAWVVFTDPEGTRRAMTAKLYADSMPEAAKLPTAPIEDTRARIVERMKRTPFDPALRGVYVGRSITRAVRTYKELAGTFPTDPAEIRAALDALYPESLVETLKAWRAAVGEVDQLQALADGVLSAPGGVIRFRGRTLRRPELPAALAEAKAARDALADTLVSHDRAVRTAHRAAARALGKGWDAHLVGLAATLHYLEHLDANLTDANGHLANVFAIVTADGKVSSAELNRLVTAANELHGALYAIYSQAGALRLPRPVAEKLEVESWKKLLEEDLKLTPATRESLAGNWLEAAQSWFRAANAALDATSGATLEALLEAEAHVARCFGDGTDPGEAPEPPLVPTHYPTSAPGQERPRQKRLDAWSRFVTADGVGAGTARFAVASAVLAPALVFGSSVGTSTVIVHNGLHTDVRVLVGDTAVTLGDGEDRRVTVDPVDDLAIVTKTRDGRLIESFTADAGEVYTDYVYNVAGADLLVSVGVPYGDIAVHEPRFEGTPRWYVSAADYTFEDPPRSIEADHPEAREHVFAPELEEAAIVAYTPEDQRAELARVHATWDAPTSAGFAMWVAVAKSLGVDVSAALAAHPEEERRTVEFGRVEQNVGGPEVCATFAARAQASPDDADAAYLAARCLEGAEGDAAIRAAATRFPDHAWLRWALAYAESEEGRYAEALVLLDSIAGSLPSVESDLRDQRLRLLRITGAPLETQMASTAPESGLDAILAAEAHQRGDLTALGEDGAPLHALASGDLPRLLSLTQQNGPEYAWYLWMAAASDGATPAMRDAAFALTGTDHLGSVSVWPALALLTDAGKDRAEADAVAARMNPPLFEAVRPVLDAPKAGLAAAVEAAAAGKAPHERGTVRLVGVLRAGQDAPEAWREEARLLLFPWERPYLRAPGAVHGAGDGVAGEEAVGEEAGVEGGVVGGVLGGDLR